MIEFQLADLMVVTIHNVFSSGNTNQHAAGFGPENINKNQLFVLFVYMFFKIKLYFLTVSTLHFTIK